jgi:LCP family protein required for cell wall assembly
MLSYPLDLANLAALGIVILANEREASVGKHVKRKTGLEILKGCLVWLTILLFAIGIGSFVFAKILESKLHSNPHSIKDKESYLSAPLPNKPVYFLLVGSDLRSKDDVGRADTIIVARVNPVKKMAHLISIPRDLRVKIPDHGRGKINSAYAFGGPELMVRTVENFLGVELNHYVVIHFLGFKHVIDALGGVDIYIEKPLKDRRLKMYFKPGYQHLDGEEALKFVRTRKVDDDFGRMKRQQKFLRAVMRKMLSLGSVLQLPRIATIVADNTLTDNRLGIPEMISYGRLIRAIPEDKIYMTTIPGRNRKIGKMSYVVVNTDKVEWLVERMERDMPFKLTAEERQNQEVKVVIQNGSGRAGLAKKLAQQLQLAGFDVRKVGNADSFSYAVTQIRSREDDYNKALRVQNFLGFGEIVVEDLKAKTDVLIVVGSDYDYSF